MLVKLGQTLKTLEGEDIKDEKGKALTVAQVAIQALFISDETDSGEMKAEKYQLAVRIHKTEKEKDTDLTVEQIATIKKCIGKSFAPIVVGQIYDIIENGSSPAK